MVAMERKRTYFDDIHQDVNKIKKYASDLQTFIGVKEMTSVVEVKKKKRAFNYDLFELKLDFLQELESFVKDVSIVGVISKRYIIVPILQQELNCKRIFHNHNSQERRMSIFKIGMRGVSV